MKPITNVELFSLVYYTIIKNSNIRFPVDKQNTKIATYVKLLQLKNKKIEKSIWITNSTNYKYTTTDFEVHYNYE